MSTFDSIISKNKHASFFSRTFVQPEGMSYAAWQKQLKKIFNSFLRKKRYFKSHKRYKNFILKLLSDKRRQQNKQREQLITKQTTTILNQLPTTDSETKEDTKLELISICKQFCERKGIHKLVEETIPDRRNQDLIVYSKQSLMMSAMMIFLFRMASGNRFDDKSHDDDNKYSKANVAKFIDAPEDRVPVIKTIEKFLCNLEIDSVNNLMIAFFKDLQKSKFFKQHPDIMPGDFFLLAADCVHTHTYDHLHHIDKDGKNDCDCCLERVYNKGTENEKIKWQHHMLVFSFIFLGGLKIPIYRHCIRAKQIVNLESASDAVHKQECELVALKTALPIIRKAFPRMQIVLLLDGLYANKPVIRFAKEQKCEYIIVRKDACLTTLASDCDGQAKLPNHTKNCSKTYRGIDKGWKIERRYEWFNSTDLEESTKKKINTNEKEKPLTTNVLRFSETRTNGKETKTYKCEWLCSKMLSMQNCQIAVYHARLRWEEEDVFNSLKTRGYNLGHDFSRNPRSCFNWQGIALFAFAVFELFRFSEVVKQRGDLPRITLAETLQAQLLQRPTEELFSKCHLKIKIQFRYNFIIEPIVINDAAQNYAVSISKTG
jgi:hypothetical protein